MAKRGRKPSKNKKNYYFCEEQEEAVREYLSADTKDEKDAVFDKWLRPAFTKMAESIIRRYNLYLPDEEFKQTFDDTISFLMTKIDNFNPNTGYKAYSYYGTICKNYLIYKINQFNKNQKRNERYDAIQTDLTNNIKFSYDESSNKVEFLNDLITKTIMEIRNIIKKKDKNKLTDDEIKVGRALIELMSNWEDLFEQMGSNKFNKSSILLFLKETTLLNTKQIRDGMKKYKSAYYMIKKSLINV